MYVFLEPQRVQVSKKRVLRERNKVREMEREREREKAKAFYSNIERLIINYY